MCGPPDAALAAQGLSVCVRTRAVVCFSYPEPRPDRERRRGPVSDCGAVPVEVISNITKWRVAAGELSIPASGALGDLPARTLPALELPAGFPVCACEKD